MNVQEIHVWPLLAGLGLFLFGMHMLEEALKILAGRSFKKFLRKQTSNPIKAVLSGALVTVLLQSSSMVSLLVMSFAGAGIIGLKNGIGIIIGANLGTTVTGWLVSLIGFKLDIGTSILPFIALGGLGFIFFKSEKLSQVSKMIMGFSLMFLGLDYMKDSFELFAKNIDFHFLENKHPVLFLLFGFGLAAAIRSSSASMMIFLSSLATGMISLPQAAFLVIGADLGTTVTAILGTINANSIRRKVGWSQFFFNVFTAIITLVFMNFYFYIIERFLNISDPLIALVAFHSILNLAGIIFILPLLNIFTKLIDKFISGKEVALAKKIMLVNPAESSTAIEALHNESIEFYKKTIDILHTFFELPHATEPASEIHNYTDLKNYENEIVSFYLKIQQTSITNEEATKVNSLIAAIRNATLSAKDLKDIKHNLDELSGSPQDDLFGFYKKIRVNQKKFYDELIDVAHHISSNNSHEIFRLKDILRSHYEYETEDIYKLFETKKHREIVIPTLLNMIRAINNSNESLLRSLSSIIVKDEQ